MKLITVDSTTMWKSLPWAQISEKVFIIQQKLYKYSKEYSIKKIYKLQDRVMSSSDTKILAIQEVSDYITEYYINCNHETYNLDDADKLLIYQSLFKDYVLSDKIKFIVEKVKQYLVYICLKPEWEARFEPICKSNINSQTQCYFIYRLSKFISNRFGYLSHTVYSYYLNYQITSKYLDISYLNNKIQSLTCIKNYISHWLNNQYLLESLNNNVNIKALNIDILTTLDKLLYKIIYTGIEWYYMKSIESVVKVYNIFQDLYSFFDNYNHFWIYTKKSLLKNIFFQNIVFFLKALGYYNIIFNDFFDIIQPKTNLISDYHILHNNIYGQNLLQDNSQLTIQFKPNVYKQFLLQIKYLLYHKDIIGRLRLNTRRDLFSFLMKTNKKIISFYEYYYPIINLDNINILFQLINNIFVTWTKKNNKDYLLFHRNKQYLMKYLFYYYR